MTRPNVTIRRWQRLALILLAPMLAILVVTRAPRSLAADAVDPWTKERFDREIAPILATRCLECHRGSEPEGKLDLSDQTAALRGGESGAGLVPGNVAGSLLWARIDAGEMPPDEPLPAKERQLIRDWIAARAVWGTNPIDPFRATSAVRAGYDWWSLQPLVRPAIPQIVDPSSARQPSDESLNPIDGFVRARLRTAGLAPSPPAAARTIMRRLHFDLLGLPPAPMAVQRFEMVHQDNPPQAISELVDRLLASRHFGERWGRHWLDVVRFGESQGFERDKLRTASWYYRDWVIDAINRDLPYDQFVRWQIAGDVLHPSDPAAITATGFLVAGPWDEVGQSQRSQAMKAIVRQDELEDYVGTIGQTFLGLTVNCARCHDHKFDPIRQTEYYRLASALDGVRHGYRQVSSSADRQHGGQTDPPQDSHQVYAVKPGTAGTTHVLLRGNPANPGEVVTPGGVAAVPDVDADFHLAHDAQDADRRRQLAAWITDARNPLFARVIVNRLWHYHFGVGLVATPNDFGFNGGRPSHPQLLDWLASELVDSGWRLKHLHRLIITSATYLQASRYRADGAAVDVDNRLLWRKSLMRLEAEALRDTILSVAGELNPHYGGAPYQDFDTHVANSQFYQMTDPDGPEFYRRTVYRTWIRSGRNHLLDAFDCPDPSTTAPQRAVTTTPIQSLALLNNSFVLRMSDRFAARVGRDVGPKTSAQVARVYQLAFGRAPSEDESDVAREFITSYGLSAFCRVVFNSNEFIHVD